MNKIINICILLLLLSSCTKYNKSNNQSCYKLRSDKKMTEFCDSSFLTNQVLCLDVSLNKILLTDYNASQIIILDKNLKLIKRLGRKGNGPGEFAGAAHFCLNKNHIYTINEAGHAIVDIERDKYQKLIHFPQNVSLTNSTRFFYYNNFFYHSVDSPLTPIVCFNETEKKNICGFTLWDNAKLSYHSARHLVKGIKSFYVVGQTLPIFQEYSFDGKLLNNYELNDNIPEIKKLIEEYKSKPQVPNTRFVMIQDVFYSNKKLYMLMSTKDNHYTSNKILVFDVANKIKHIATLELEGKVFQSFCVIDNRLIAFNALDAGLDAFIIPKLK